MLSRNNFIPLLILKILPNPGNLQASVCLCVKMSFISNTDVLTQRTKRESVYDAISNMEFSKWFEDQQYDLKKCIIC